MKTALQTHADANADEWRCPSFAGNQYQRTCTPSHLRGTFSTAARIAASAFSTHCCLLCVERAILMVRVLPPVIEIMPRASNCSGAHI